MNEYGCTVRLRHGDAQAFFEAAMRPDLEELRQRDAFLAALERECPVRAEGDGLVTQIPDMDVSALLGDKAEYIAAYTLSVHTQAEGSENRPAYTAVSMAAITLAA